MGRFRVKEGVEPAMQTHFTEAQKADPDIAEADKILRNCVHCGFCTATCPTYVLLGDELDSPRGRIYLIKDMLENDRPATEQVVKHLDRCLSCLACMTTCPSGVHYMHLIDHARAHVEETYKRPWFDRVQREVLARLIPYPGRFKAALALGALSKPLAPLLPARLRAIAPEINDATLRLLRRHGAEVVFPADATCCGSLVHHMGREEQSHAQAKAMIDAWWPETAAGFVVSEAAEAHLCCGSAGTYNLLQPEIATRLRDRKLGHIAATAPEIIAAGNIGCITQLATKTSVPVVHTVELLDWATGGPKPAGVG